QMTQSDADASLRTALENMRYGACTTEDIQFLYTHVANRLSSETSLRRPEFRNISIITAWNSFKDRYNDLGCSRFVREANQVLHEFHSVDTTCPSNNDEKKRKGKKRAPWVALSKARQTLLWNMEPHTSEHIPGKLMLCQGLPVILRHNDATELCITKGQEGHIMGWDSVEALEKVYVKLDLKSPRKVQIPNLPENVAKP
ncbi:hypothetical protein BKA70DRAFT_1133835, partial [Coprinopsis sp. MPI-PUGE-AT-0042]